MRQFNYSNLTMHIVETRNPNPSALPSTAVAVPATRWTKSRSRRTRGSFNLTADLPFCDYDSEFKICATRYMTGCGRVASTAPVCKEATSGETAPFVFNQPPLPEKSSITPVPVEVLQRRPSESLRRRIGVLAPQSRRSSPSSNVAVNREREHVLASATAATPRRLQVTTPASLKPVFADDSVPQFSSRFSTWLAAIVNLGNRRAITSRLVKHSAPAAALIVLFVMCFSANLLGNLSGSVPLSNDSPPIILILEFVQSVAPPSAPFPASVPNASLASAIVPHRSVEFHSKLCQYLPDFCSIDGALFNNVARTGGAVGALSSTLNVIGSYGLAIGMQSWSCPIESACKSYDSGWQAPTSLHAASALPWRDMRPHVIHRVHEALPGDTLPRPRTSTVSCRSKDAILHPSVLSPCSCRAPFLLPDFTFLMNDPRCVTWPCQYIQSVAMSFEEPCSAVPNMLLSNAAPIVRAVAFHSQKGGKALPLLSVQPNELRHALSSSTDTFVSNLLFSGAICILVVAAVCRTMHVLQRFRASKLSHHTPFGRPHRSIAVSAITAFLFCASFLHSAAAADTAVVVDPSKGQDVPDCGLTGLAPCLTILYALRTRRATSVLLSEGVFNEINIYVDSIAPFFSVSGLRNSTVFDCGGRGPAFIIANTSVAIAGVTFQNCVNFNASGTGGAISAHSNSVITVTDCAFYNNTAQTGGAIGAISSTVSVTSSLFESNTATCPNASAACSAWGGAIGAVEAPSVTIKNNNFNRNAVNLELNGVRDPASSAAAGGGCVSVLYNSDVSDSRVTMDGNTFQSCSVRMSGSRVSSTATSGVQYGNAYGGAVSVYYGLRAASLLQVRNVASSFTNNLCRGSVIDARVTNLLYLQLARCKSRYPKTYDISKHSLQFTDGRITK